MVALQSQPGQFSIYQMWPLLVLEQWLQAQSAARKVAHDALTLEAA